MAMACRQMLPCRRCCRLRPFLLVLVLAAFLFYQTLIPLRTRRDLLAVGNGVLPNGVAEVQHRRRYEEVSTRQACCFLPSSNLQGQKEIEDSIFKYFRSQARAVILYIPSSGNKQDLQLYQNILQQNRYTVTVLEDRKLSGHEQFHPDDLHSWDLLICLSSSKADHEHCLNVVESHQTTLLQKANALPPIQRLLCRKQGLCQLVRTFPDLQLPIVFSDCPESNIVPDLLQAVKSHDGTERTGFAHMLYQPTKTVQQHQIFTQVDNKKTFKIQDLSVIIKVYVLVTSLTPLRAFIHSSGVARFPPRKKYFSIKLQALFETFLKASSPQQAFDDMKETMSKLLLVTEVFSETPSSGPKISNQCSSCFQMLTFDIGFSRSLYPIVLEVHEHFDFQADDDANVQDQSVKQTVLGDTFRILSSNKSSSSIFFEALRNVYQSAGIKAWYHQKEPDNCLTLEELNPLISFVEELQNKGQFELLFPSAVPKIQFLLHDLYRMVNPGRKVGSILNAHWLLLNLLEELLVINKVGHINFPGWQNKNARNVSQMKPRWSNLRTFYSAKGSIKDSASSTFTEKHEGLHFLKPAKEMHCSHDKDALLLVRQIFTSPHLDLNPTFDPKIKEYYSEVPFDVVTVKIKAEPANCQCEVHLDEKKGPSAANYPLGLGMNRINILVTVDSPSLQEVLSIYKIIIYREDRPSLPLFDDFMVCGFVQDCGLLIHPEESCGLQPLSAEYLSTISQPQLKTCEMGDTKGQWIVPCLSCSDNRTCDWRQITWQPDNCQYPVLNKPELQQCVENKKILFIGDSTNRGMMYYLIERVNETLQEWQKAHDMKFYHNVNNRKSSLSYSYYPQFWIDVNQRPTFEDALEQLLVRSQPLENTGQTILVVGGVQWLNFHHLHIIHKVLQRTHLSNILVVIKSLGLGFHLPVDGVHSLSLTEVQNLWNENLAVLNMAKHYGYEVVDTFIITMGRYKEFLQGKCGCHFHEVVKSKTAEGNSPMAMTLSKPHALGRYFSNRSHLMQLQAYSSDYQSPYHVRGPINQVYSQILLSRICGNERKAAGT